MSASALRATPLDIQTFRAFRTGKGGDHEEVAQCASRFCKLLGRALASLCATPPVFTLERVSAPAAMAEAAAEQEGVQAFLQQAEPPRLVRVTLDKPLVFALCDLFLGGTGGDPPYAEQRPHSHIERDIARHFIAILGEAMPQAFAGEAPLSLSLLVPKEAEGDEPPPFTPAVAINILATLMGYSGDIRIELPAEIVSLAKGAAAAAAEKSKPAASQSGWQEQIAQSITPTELELSAVLTSFQMTLEDIGKLLPGQLIRLPATLAKPVSLESDGVALHRARLGQQSRRFCLSILEPEGAKD